MKIAFNARYLYDRALRGLNRYCFCLLQALEGIPGIQLYLLSERRFPVHEFYRSALRAQVIDLLAPRTLLWEQWVLPRCLKQLKPDVFHAPADGGLPLRKECPYVLTLHGVPRLGLAQLVNSGELSGSLADYLDIEAIGVRPTLRALRARAMSRIYLRAADVVITVSEFSKRELVQLAGLSPDSVRVIHEAPADIFTQPLSVEHIESVRVRYGISARFVLFVGGFDKRKNVPTLLAAFAGLKKREPDVGLVLVGIGGNVWDARHKCAELGLREGEDVFFLQQKPDDEIAALYRGASLFTTLSWHEGFCLPILEAMASGTPVVASSFGAIPEILGDAGILVDPRRTGDIIDSMQMILCRPDLRASLTARSLSRAKHFSWQRTAQETMNVYAELCARYA